MNQEKIFNQKIYALRKKEFKFLSRMSACDSVNEIFANIFPYLLIFVILMTYTYLGNDIKSTNVFTIVGLANMMVILIPIN